MNEYRLPLGINLNEDHQVHAYELAYFDPYEGKNGHLLDQGFVYFNPKCCSHLSYGHDVYSSCCDYGDVCEFYHFHHMVSYQTIHIYMSSMDKTCFFFQGLLVFGLYFKLDLGVLLILILFLSTFTLIMLKCTTIIINIIIDIIFL